MSNEDPSPPEQSVVDEAMIHPGNYDAISDMIDVSVIAYAFPVWGFNPIG